MVFDSRQGDIFLFNTLDGGEIQIVLGEPVMDQGFESAVYLSIAGSKTKDWFANEYLPTNRQIKSRFAKFAEGRELTSSSILTGEELAKKDLQWMIDTGIADSVDLTMVEVSRNRVEIEVIVLIGDEEVRVSPFQLNWAAQRDFPASERVG